MDAHNFSNAQVDLITQAMDQRLEMLNKSLSECQAKRNEIDEQLACNDYNDDIDNMVQQLQSYDHQIQQLTEMIKQYEQTKKEVVGESE